MTPADVPILVPHRLPGPVRPAWDALMAQHGYYHGADRSAAVYEGREPPEVYFCFVGDADRIEAAAVLNLPARSSNPLMLPSERLRSATLVAPDDPRLHGWDTVDVDNAVFLFGRSLAPCAVGHRPQAAMTLESFVDDCLTAADGLARKHGRPALAALAVPVGGQLHAQLTERGFLQVPGLSHFHLPTAGLRSFEDYVARLSSARRSSIRRERRRLAPITIEDGALEPRHAEHFAPLLAAHEAKYGLVGDVAAVASRLQRTGNGPVPHRYLAAFDDAGRCVGVLLYFVWANVMYASEIGIAPAEPLLYFELTYYRPIETAVREGYAAIDYSVGSREAKLSRGCVETVTATMLRTVPEIAVP